MEQPLRLWYTMGQLEITDPGPLINPPSNIRTLMRYRAALDKKNPENRNLDKRIESTWNYLGCLAWCLRHHPSILDGTSFVWTRDKSESILSDKGVALEYFITLLSLTGLFANKAKHERDQKLHLSAAPHLELCSQACTYAALHVQKYGEHFQQTAFAKVSPSELSERARLLELCALQERIDMQRPNGALHLMGELRAFSLSAQQTGMRMFALCMLTDWRLALAQSMIAGIDPLRINRDKGVYQRTIRAQHFLLSVGRNFEQQCKKESKKFSVPSVLVEHVTKVKASARQTLDNLKLQRAKYNMVTGEALGDLDPIPESSATDPIEQDLFDSLDPNPLQSADPDQNTAFAKLLQIHVDTFASGDAHGLGTKPRPLVETPIQDLDTYAYMKIPVALKRAVLWGIAVERRHRLEEEKILWPRPDVDDELATLVAHMNKTGLV